MKAAYQEDGIECWGRHKLVLQCPPLFEKLWSIRVPLVHGSNCQLCLGTHSTFSHSQEHGWIESCLPVTMPYSPCWQFPPWLCCGHLKAPRQTVVFGKGLKNGRDACWPMPYDWWTGPECGIRPPRWKVKWIPEWPAPSIVALHTPGWKWSWCDLLSGLGRRLMRKVVVWGRPWMKWLPGWGCPRRVGNERLLPPSLGEEASIGCGQKIAWRGRFQQRLV